MKLNRIAVLTSKQSWFLPYAEEFTALLKKQGNQAGLFTDHKKIPKTYEAVFMLSYFKVVDKGFLSRHRYNLVVHESNLPAGRGWAPLFWQILEGKNRIPIVLLNAEADADVGGIYLKEFIRLKGDELHEEIRRIQAEKTVELCLRFLKDYSKLKPKKQKCRASFYRKRTPQDSCLDINKSLKEQFNLLRIVNNKDFPAFFIYKKKKYYISIEKDKV